jgi:Fe-S-cluster containining protein
LLVPIPLRVDPEQRFTCAQCGQCCYRWDVVVSSAEIEWYRRRNVAAWYRESREADDAAGPDVSAEAQRAPVDPFEPVPGIPTLHRIRKRADGGCGFLSPDNQCRIHQELGADRKPLACRMYPYSFHAAADGVVVTASFGCPTIVANEGASAGASRDQLEALRLEWYGTRPAVSAPREFVAGRSIDGRTTRVVRENLLAILKSENDIRVAIRRIAAALDDLSRHRVVSLSDHAFAEYVALTLPHAAKNLQAPPSRPPGMVARLLQYGFLYAVAAARLRVEQRDQAPAHSRLAAVRLLAHFHRVAPPQGRVNVGALSRTTIDLNDPDLRPIVFHYLRSSLEALGARQRPLLDDLSIAASYLNAAIALAIMNASAAGRVVDRQVLSEALMEAVHLSHTDDQAMLAGILRRMTGGTGALWLLQS